MNTTAKQNADKQAQQKSMHLSAAIAAVRKEVGAIGEKLRVAEGDDKVALQARMAELLSELGMDYDPSAPIVDFFAPDNKAEDSSAKTEEAATDAPATTAPSTDGWWARFKAFLSRNRTVIIVGVCTAAAAIAAWFKFSKATGATTTSASFFKGVVEGETTTGDADGGIMTKIGDFFVAAFAAVKKGMIAAKDWIVGLFTKSDATATTGGEQPMPSAA